MKLRVLVVDDDPLYRELLKCWLESEGHEAILAGTLEEGFVGIATEPLPDAILLDVRIAKNNGLTLIHWARKQRHLAGMPIAAITRIASLKDWKSIEEAGCDACLIKPIDFNALRKFLVALGIHSTS